MTRLQGDPGNDLPKARKTADSGWAPDPDPALGRLLADRLHADAEARGPKPRATTTARFRHSDAGNCSRAVAYAALNIPATDPMDVAGHFVTKQGEMIHEEWQADFLHTFNVLDGSEARADVEVTVVLLDGETAGSVDGVLYAEDGHVTDAIEGKSLGGYAYKIAVGERGPAQGPKPEHVIQGALNARALDADRMVICYWTREAISVQSAQRKKIPEIQRVTAQWTMTREEYAPIADKELERIKAILALLDDGVLPKRKIPSPELPPSHVITDPATGGWVAQDKDGNYVDAGSFWACAYCSWQTLCTATPADRCKISEVPVVVEAMKS